MDQRYVRAVIWVAALLTAQACERQPANPSAAVVGRAVSGTWQTDGSEQPVLAWVFRGDDYLGCRSYASEIRRLQARYGTEFKLSLVYVGKQSDWVAPFTRTERLNARIINLRPREYNRLFGELPLPAIYLVHGRRIVQVQRIDLSSDRTTVRNALETALRQSAVAPVNHP